LSSSSASPIPEPAAGGPVVVALERSAITHLGSHLRLWATAVIGLAADLWTKEWAFRDLPWGESRPLIEHVCSLQLSLNPGALFGIGAGLAPIFVGASVLALMFVLYLFANSAVSRRSMHVALGLVLAGAIGNLYDRTTESAYVLESAGGRIIGRLLSESPQAVTVGDYPDGSNPRIYPRGPDARGGHQPVVRDFLKIEARVGGLALWPWIFNVADALLVVGVAVLLLNFWSERHAAPRPAEAAPA
jgi:lipoprotein signal peptidase